MSAVAAAPGAACNNRLLYTVWPPLTNLLCIPVHLSAVVLVADGWWLTRYLTAYICPGSLVLTQDSFRALKNKPGMFL